MLPNGQQQINQNKTNTFAIFPGYHQQLMSGQSIMMTPNGVPCLVQPVYNMQAIIQNTNQSETSHVLKPQKKNVFSNLSSTGPKNADEMIKSIISDSRSLIDDVPKRQAGEKVNNLNNNAMTGTLGHLSISGAPFNQHFLFQQGADYSRNQFISAPPALPQNDEDDFGEFVGVQPISTSESSPCIQIPSLTNAPNKVQLTSHCNQFAHVSSFVPVAEVVGSPDDFSLYGIQLPKWITNSRLVPEVYTRVLNSVTKNSSIDTYLVHSELMKSGLPRELLGHLWELCNKKIKGRIDRCELFLMLAMISICQNNLDCSSLHVLTKCPQAPIPKWNGPVDFGSPGQTQPTSPVVSLENDFTTAHNPSCGVESFNGSIVDNTKARPHCGIKDPTSPIVGESIAFYEINNVHPVQLNALQHKCAPALKVTSKDQFGGDDDGDVEFDDFQAAPDLSVKLPPPSTSSSLYSSSSSMASYSPPPPPQETTKKAPTLLSLASPVMANPPTSLLYLPSTSSASPPVPTLNMLPTYSMQDFSPVAFNHAVLQSFSPLSERGDLSPQNLMSNAAVEDKYAAFREFQVTEQDKHDNDEDFGEFESGICNEGMQISNKPSSGPVAIGNHCNGLMSSLTHPKFKTTISGSEEFRMHSNAGPTLYQHPSDDAACNKSSLGREPIVNLQLYPEGNISACNAFHFKSFQANEPHQDASNKCHQHAGNIKTDWSDFLGLDGDQDSKFRGQISKICDTMSSDDFDDFVSHEDNVSYSSGVTGPVHSSSESSRQNVNAFDQNAKLDFEHLYDDFVSDKKKDFDHSFIKDGNHIWNSMSDIADEDPLGGIAKKLHGDDVSFRSLEFKVSKHLSCIQTPDDSQSTSSATDLEKKSTDNRSISSLELYPSNDSNVATASSGNSLANNTTDPSPNFLFGSGKPLDAKEILNRMGGVIAADRYYDLTDHSKDPDSHAYQWTRCFKVVETMLKQANDIFSDSKDKNLTNELLKLEGGSNYLKAIYSEELVKVQKSIDAEWQKLLCILPIDDMSLMVPSLLLASLDHNDPSVRPLLELRDLDAYKWSCGLCLLRVAEPKNSISLPGVSGGSTDPPLSMANHGLPMSLDRLEYGGRLYHPQCANLWINCVDLTLPSLNIPELL